MASWRKVAVGRGCGFMEPKLVNAWTKLSCEVSMSWKMSRCGLMKKACL